MIASPALVTLYGDRPEMGFWVTAAITALKAGSGIAKRIAKRVKAKRKKKKAKAAARRVAAAAPAVVVANNRTGAPRVARSVTTNELYAARARAPGFPPALILGGAAVAAVVLLSRRGVDNGIRRI